MAHCAVRPIVLKPGQSQQFLSVFFLSGAKALRPMIECLGRLTFRALGWCHLYAPTMIKSRELLYSDTSFKFQHQHRRAHRLDNQKFETFLFPYHFFSIRLFPWLLHGSIFTLRIRPARQMGISTKPVPYYPSVSYVGFFSRDCSISVFLGNLPESEFHHWAGKLIFFLQIRTHSRQLPSSLSPKVFAIVMNWL